MVQKTKSEKIELSAAKRAHKRFKRLNPLAWNVGRQEIILQIATSPTPNWGNLTLQLMK